MPKVPRLVSNHNGDSQGYDGEESKTHSWKGDGQQLLSEAVEKQKVRGLGEEELKAREDHGPSEETLLLPAPGSPETLKSLSSFLALQPDITPRSKFGEAVCYSAQL